MKIHILSLPSSGRSTAGWAKRFRALHIPVSAREWAICDETVVYSSALCSGERMLSGLLFVSMHPRNHRQPSGAKAHGVLVVTRPIGGIRWFWRIVLFCETFLQKIIFCVDRWGCFRFNRSHGRGICNFRFEWNRAPVRWYALRPFEHVPLRLWLQIAPLR